MNAADFRRQMGADLLSGPYDLNTPSSTETWVIVQPGKEHEGWTNPFLQPVKLVYRSGRVQRYEWLDNAWPRIVAELHNWPQ